MTQSSGLGTRDNGGSYHGIGATVLGPVAPIPCSISRTWPWIDEQSCERVCPHPGWAQFQTARLSTHRRLGLQQRHPDPHPGGSTRPTPSLLRQGIRPLHPSGQRQKRWGIAFVAQRIGGFFQLEYWVGHEYRRRSDLNRVPGPGTGARGSGGGKQKAASEIAEAESTKRPEQARR